jgi:hypothetical protein
MIPVGLILVNLAGPNLPETFSGILNKTFSGILNKKQTAAMLKSALAKVPMAGGSQEGSYPESDFDTIVFPADDLRQKKKSAGPRTGRRKQPVANPSMVGRTTSGGGKNKPSPVVAQPKASQISFPALKGVTESSTTVKDLQIAMGVFQDRLKKVQQEHNLGSDTLLAYVMDDLVIMIGAMDNFQRNLTGIVVWLANMAKLAKNALQPDHNHDPHRLVKDSSDKLEQRYLKGKFVLSTVVKPGENRAYPEEDRKDSGLAGKVVVDMVKRKLGVTIAPNDLRTCHYTQNGSIVFRMGDLKYNSPYDEIMRAIKSGKNRDIPVYFNFMLT